MKYEFSLAKQIAEKGLFLRMTASVQSAPGDVDVCGVDEPLYRNAIEFAANYFFERESQLKPQGCRIEITKFEAVPFDTGLLCIVLGTIDILCQHYRVNCADILLLDDHGNFCFPG